MASYQVPQGDHETAKEEQDIEISGVEDRAVENAGKQEYEGVNRANL